VKDFCGGSVEVKIKNNTATWICSGGTAVTGCGVTSSYDYIAPDGITKIRFNCGNCCVPYGYCCLSDIIIGCSETGYSEEWTIGDTPCGGPCGSSKVDVCWCSFAIYYWGCPQ